MDKLKIGISVGDINGIGLEVILKTLANNKISDICTPIVYGSSKVVSYHKNIAGVDFQFNSIRELDQVHPGKVNIINCWQENVSITLGKATDLGGQYAFKSLQAAVRDLKENRIDALVTAPINKAAMQMADFPHTGHTEYLTQELGAGESLMFMISGDLRIGVVTNHIPVKAIAGRLTRELLINKIKIMNDSLKMDFGLERPTIAVLGLNPHAGDDGLIGDEEEKIIRPAIIELKKSGLLVMGPFPADGFYGSGRHRKFDAVLAMYHDQGLIPFKLLSFGDGINFTAGLSGVRTSPDHGTAYDIAGKNQADPSSFRKALFSAVDIGRNRKKFLEMHENVLVKHSKHTESEDETIFEEDLEEQ